MDCISLVYLLMIITNLTGMELSCEQGHLCELPPNIFPKLAQVSRTSDAYSQSSVVCAVAMDHLQLLAAYT